MDENKTYTWHEMLKERGIYDAISVNKTGYLIYVQTDDIYEYDDDGKTKVGEIYHSVFLLKLEDNHIYEFPANHHWFDEVFVKTNKKLSLIEDY